MKKISIKLETGTARVNDAGIPLISSGPQKTHIMEAISRAIPKNKKLYKHELRCVTKDLATEPLFGTFPFYRTSQEASVASENSWNRNDLEKFRRGCGPTSVQTTREYTWWADLWVQ